MDFIFQLFAHMGLEGTCLCRVSSLVLVKGVLTEFGVRKTECGLRLQKNKNKIKIQTSSYYTADKNDSGRKLPSRLNCSLA